MNKSSWWCLLLVASLSAACPRLAQAQTDKLEETSYSFADHPPQLPSGGIKALTAAIQANFHFPTDAPRAQQVGSFGVNAVVSTKGQVAWVSAYGTMRDRIKPSVVAAALAAVRQLPRLRPALTNGEPIQFSFDIHFRLTGQPGSPLVEINERYLTTPTEAPDLSGLAGYGNQLSREPVLNRVYTFVEQMPALPGGGGTVAILNAIVQRLVVPRDAVEGKVFVRFVVNQEGEVTTPAIVVGVSPKTDAAVLAAVKKLPRFTPGRQNGQLVQVEYTLPVRVYQPTSPATNNK